MTKRFREGSPIDRDAITVHRPHRERNAIDAEKKTSSDHATPVSVSMKKNTGSRPNSTNRSPVRQNRIQPIQRKKATVGRGYAWYPAAPIDDTRKRLSVLRDTAPAEEPLDEDWWDLETEERVEQMVTSSPPADPGEREEVRRLLSRSPLWQPDPRQDRRSSTSC